MHKWLVDHGWLGDFPGTGSRIMSYTAFIGFMVLPVLALIEWMWETNRGRSTDSGRGDWGSLQ